MVGEVRVRARLLQKVKYLRRPNVSLGDEDEPLICPFKLASDATFFVQHKITTPTNLAGESFD